MNIYSLSAEAMSLLVIFPLCQTLFWDEIADRKCLGASYENPFTSTFLFFWNCSIFVAMTTEAVTER